MPGYLASIGPQTAVGLTGMIFGDKSLQEEAHNAQLYQPYYLPAPQGGGEIAADILTKAPPEVLAAMAPMSGVSRLAEAAGAVPRIARTIGAGVTGLLSGARHSGQESAIQAGEFTAGQIAADFIPGGTIPRTIARVAAQAAVPMLGQAARGNDLTSTEGLIQAGTQAGMQLLHDRATLFPKKAQAEPTPMELRRTEPVQQKVPPTQPVQEEQVFRDLFPSQRRVPSPPEDLFSAPKTEGNVMDLIPSENKLMSREEQGALDAADHSKWFAGRLNKLKFYAEGGESKQFSQEVADMLRNPRVQNNISKGANSQVLEEAAKLAKEFNLQEVLENLKASFGSMYGKDAAEIAGAVLPKSVSVHPPTSDKPHVISTAVQLPDGTVIQGDEPFAGHPTIFPKAPPETGIEDLFNGAGFWIQDAQGNQRFAPREEALGISVEAGQVPKERAAGVTKLTSEMLKGTSEYDNLIIEPAKPMELKPKVDPIKALRDSLMDARERLNAARAMGDTEEIGSIESEIKVIGKALRKSEEPKTKIPLKKKEDRLMLSAGAPIRTALGGGIGYMFGDTEEERQKNAMLGAGGALFGPMALKKAAPAMRALGMKMESAARRETHAEGQGGSVLGKVTRTLEQQFNLNRSKQTTLAMEKGKGVKSQLVHEVEDSLRQNQDAFREGMNNATSRAAGEKFIASSGKAPDIAALESSGAPQGFIDALKAQKAAQREAQLTLKEGESDPGKRAMYGTTLGDYQTRLYRIDSDPKMWKLDEPTIQKVVDEFQNGPLKDMDRGVIEQNLRQGLAERRNGTDPFLNAGGSKIKQTLFDHRLDLTPDQWGFIDQMSKDPRMPKGVDSVLTQFFKEKSIDPAGQKFLKAMAGNKALSDSERAMFREMGDKQILTKNYRDLLGEITDPFERQLYTLNKLFGSVAQAQTISEISNSVLPSGLKMAYGTEDFARLLNDPATAQTAQGYVKLPDAPGFGKLAGQHVPRDVADALTEIQSSMKGWYRYVAKANNWVKEAATAWNPSVQVRQAIQSGFFLPAARVFPWEIGNNIRALELAIKGGSDAVMKELRQQHITEANYGHQELRNWADKIALGKEKNAFSKLRDKVRNLYGIPDDFVRIAAYLKHKPRYWEEALEKGLVGDAAERYARDNTTIFVNDHTMNYGQVPKGIKTLRNIPGISPFASYSAELLRLTKNLAKDVATGSGRDKVWGAAGLATIYALPVALQQWARSKFLKPKEQETWDDVERLMPVADRSILKLPLGVNDKGSFKFMNLNPWMPAGDMVSVVRNAARGDLEAVMAQQPFLGVQKSPLVSALVDTAVTGEHGFTHEKLDTPVAKASRLAEAFLPSVVPPSGFLFKRALKSLTPNDEGGFGQVDPRTGTEYTPRTLGLSLIGATEKTANPEMLMRSAYYQGKEKLDQAEMQLKRVLRSGAPERQKEEARKTFELKRQQIVVELQGLRE